MLKLDGAVDTSGTTSASWAVMPNSGTDDLAGIQGDGSLTYGESGNSFTLDYSFR